MVRFNNRRPGLDRNEQEAKKERQEADSLAKSGQFEAALPHYTSAIELNPRDQFAIANRGWALVNLRRYQEALDDFNKNRSREIGTQHYCYDIGYIWPRGARATRSSRG
jgi:tetratricopeptide (TPR) repeat protein